MIPLSLTAVCLSRTAVCFSDQPAPLILYAARRTLVPRPVFPLSLCRGVALARPLFHPPNRGHVVARLQTRVSDTDEPRQCHPEQSHFNYSGGGFDPRGSFPNFFFGYHKGC